eukprot:g72451.t1
MHLDVVALTLTVGSSSRTQDRSGIQIKSDFPLRHLRSARVRGHKTEAESKSKAIFLQGSIMSTSPTETEDMLAIHFQSFTSLASPVRDSPEDPDKDESPVRDSPEDPDKDESNSEDSEPLQL